MLTDKMREAFGYDCMGNSPKLLAEADRIALEAGVQRASGDCECLVCGVDFYRHPQVQGALWATRTCEGIVKL